MRSFTFQLRFPALQSFKRYKRRCNGPLLNCLEGASWGKKGSILLPLVAFFTSRQGEITYLNILKCSSVSCLFKTLQKVLINACNDSYRHDSLNYKIQTCGRAKSGKNEYMNSLTQAKERKASFDWCI